MRNTARLLYPAAAGLSLVAVLPACAHAGVHHGKRMVVTLAGDGRNADAGNGAKAARSSLYGPWGLARDARGNLFIAEHNGNTVREITPDGVIHAFVGTGAPGHGGDGGTASAAQLKAPEGLAADASGDVYIADTGNDVVRKVDRNRTITTLAGTPGVSGESGDGGQAAKATLATPGDVALGPGDQLYVADWSNQDIRLVHLASGQISVLAGTGKQGYSGDGGPESKATFNDPVYMALDQAGNVYVSDHYNHVVRKLDAATATISTVAGNAAAPEPVKAGPATAVGLSTPHALALSQDGPLWISTNDHWIVRVSPAGTLTPAAGSGARDYNGEGLEPLAANLGAANAMLATRSGNLLVTDGHNSRLRLIDFNPPSAVDLALSDTSGHTVATDVLSANRGYGLKLVSFTRARHGSVVDPDGVLRYTPATGFTGTDTFTYTLTDEDGALAQAVGAETFPQATATISVTVAPGQKRYVIPRGPVRTGDGASWSSPATAPVPAPFMLIGTGFGLALLAFARAARRRRGIGGR